MGGINAAVEYGVGEWLFWGQGGGIRTGDYTAPGQGKIFNSRVNWGLKELGGPVDHFVLRLGYTDWSQEEVEFFEHDERLVGTEFDNRQFTYGGSSTNERRDR